MLEANQHQGLHQISVKELTGPFYLVRKRGPDLLISRVIVDDDNHREVIESAVKFSLNVGPATDTVMKQVRFFVLEKGERVVIIFTWPGLNGLLITCLRNHALLTILLCE